MSDAKKLLSERLGQWSQQQLGNGHLAAHKQLAGMAAEARTLEQELADLRETLQDAEANLRYADGQIAMLNDEVNDWRKAAQAAVTARKLAEKEAAQAREFVSEREAQRLEYVRVTARREALQEALACLKSCLSSDTLHSDACEAVQALIDAD